MEKFIPKFAFTGGNGATIEVNQENFKDLSAGNQILVNLCFLNSITPTLQVSRDGNSKWLSRDSVDALKATIFKEA